MHIDEPVVIFGLNASDSLGSFSVFKNRKENDVFYWDNCREIFAKSFHENTLGFFYVTGEKHKDSIINFVNESEKILEIKDNTKFIKTNKSGIILVIPSAFWKDCFMKRSLFTLLCRVGFFHQRSWETTIFCDKYETLDKKIDSNKEDIINTKEAIKRFFIGYTRFIGMASNPPEYGPWKYGWVQEFYKREFFEIREKLVKKTPEAIDSIYF